MKTRLMLIAFAAFVGCNGENTADGLAIPSLQVQDSGGVRIVQNTNPSSEQLLTVSGTPALRIGSSDVHATADQVLHGVADAVRLSDGRIIVLNAGMREVRSYSALGDLIAVTGRRGDGPGDFQLMSQILVGPEDDVIVFDSRLGRITVYDAALNLKTITTLRAPAGGSVLYSGRLSDGTHLAYFNHGRERRRIDNTQITRETSTVWRFGADGSPIGAVGDFSGSESVMYLRGEFAQGMPSHLGTVRYDAVHEDHLIVAFDNRYELQQYSVDGVLRQIVRRAFTPRSITDDQKGAFGVEEYFPGLIWPDHLPVIGRILLDDVGNIWVADYDLPGTRRPRRWSIFDSQGRWLADAETPPGLHVTEIGLDYVIGVVRERAAGEFVELYPLIRGG